MTASLREDGRFVIEESYVEEWTDGDEAHVVVEVDGKVEVDGTANGVLRQVCGCGTRPHRSAGPGDHPARSAPRAPSSATLVNVMSSGQAVR